MGKIYLTPDYELVLLGLKSKVTEFVYKNLNTLKHNLNQTEL
jgi:hypothetical protein